MIIDAILAIPTYIIVQIWNLLGIAETYPAGVTTASYTLGNYLARLDFILPIDTLGTLMGWYFVAIIAYFTLWAIFVILAIYQSIKLF